MAKIDLVLRVLAHPDMRDWYEDQHDTWACDFTEENMRAEKAHIANQIIEDGYQHGLISQDEYEDS